MAKVSEKTEEGDRSRVNVITYPQCSKSSKTKSPKAPENERKGRKGGSNKSPTKSSAQYVPDTNLTLACLVCLCFNMPLGAMAMYLSLTAARAYRDGDLKLGEKKAKWSVLLSLFSIVTTVLIVMSAVLWLAIHKQSQKDPKHPNET